MLVGYMRVSSTDDRQSVDLQRDALTSAGVDARHIHSDKASGARDDRAGLKACLAAEKLEAVTAALAGGASKAAVCRNFGIARSTLIGTLERIGWVGPTKT